MQNKAFRFGPVAIGAAPADVLNPPAAAGGVNAGASGQYIILNHIRFVNTTAAPVSFSAWLGATGATAAGTEVIGTAKEVAANDVYDWWGKMRIDVADFLVMDGSAVGITVEGEGEIGVAG